jgi:hypothetical protein
MRRTLWVGTTVAALALGACSGGDDEPPADAADTTTTSTTIRIDETTVTIPTTAAVPVQTPLPTGREAIDALLGAWEAGDQAAARLVASTEAVDALFAVPVERRDDRGCNSGNVNTTIQCVFRLPSGELSVRARPTLGGGFLVDFVILGS